MNRRDNPSRHAVMKDTASPMKTRPSDAGTAVPALLPTSRNRHGAITDTLAKWHSYKAWAARIHSHWKEDE